MSQTDPVRAKTVPAKPITASRPTYQRLLPRRSPYRARRTENERRAGDERTDDEPDLHAREAQVGERHADEHASQPVSKRAESLDEQDAAGVGPEAHVLLPTPQL